MRENENIEIKRIIDILLSKKIIVAGILILFILIGCIYSYNYVIPKYKSTSTLLLIPNNTSGNNGITSTDLTLNAELITTYSNIAKKSTVLSQVISNLGLNISEEQLLSKVQVTAITDTYIIEISVTDTDAQTAMNITKELANVFLKEIKQIYNLNNIGIIDEAQMQETPYNINHTKDIMLFFILGLFIAGIYIAIIYIFDNTIKKEDEIEKYIKVKTLGIVPIHINKKQKVNAKSYITECINSIRTNILYMNSGKKAKTILITSCDSKDGKSWVATNVATSFAETNKKVLLIDCDMRAGKLNKIFKINSKEGLSDYLYYMTGKVKRDVELAKEYIKETKIPNLHVLTNGTTPPNPSDLIDSENMKELLAICKNIYDVIIIDSPSCKLVTDSIILSTIVDSTVLVVSSEKTKMKDLSEVKKSIQSVGGEVIGAILNKVQVKAKTYSSSYYYANGSERGKTDNKLKRITTVQEVVDEALIGLKKKQYDISSEYVLPRREKNLKENELENTKSTIIGGKNINPNAEINSNLVEIYNLIAKQNMKLNQVIATISSMKPQIDDYDNIQKELEEEKIKNESIEKDINKMLTK